jgi:hypothetical protein
MNTQTHGLLTNLLCKNKTKISNYKGKKEIFMNNVLKFIEEKPRLNMRLIMLMIELKK